MGTRSIRRGILPLMFSLLLASAVIGCSTTQNQKHPTTTEARIDQAQKKKTFWWSALGFIVTPIGNFLASDRERK